jgi:hypothetical protein
MLQEIDEVAKKVERASHWLHFQQRVIRLEDKISQNITEADFYHRFGFQSGLTTIDPVKGFNIFHRLLDDLKEISTLYQDCYLKNKLTDGDKLNLATIESLLRERGFTRGCQSD